MKNRLIAAALTSATLVSMVPVAFAQSSDEILAEQKTMQVEQVCEGRDRSQRAYGKCIGDAINRIKLLRDEFKDALEEERTAWYNEHSNLGVSAEYRTALNEYTAEVAAKRKLFNEQQRTIEKAFFDAQKSIRLGGVSASSSSAASSRPTTRLTTTTEKEAEAKCANQKNESAIRVCMRQQLRMQTPNARTGSPAVRTNKAN